eukprot:TRINITY_DN24837_c0_g1_i5.p1 TRINITY_DN24837_c0_g1~~TRINITY_DN24837_c0_g1_i5.p1  ORF type:complete len:302 (-),score=2.93 TRINITY_DN24837_c0_g1_i5:405-1178(-)
MASAAKAAASAASYVASWRNVFYREDVAPERGLPSRPSGLLQSEEDVAPDRGLPSRPSGLLQSEEVIKDKAVSMSRHRRRRTMARDMVSGREACLEIQNTDFSGGDIQSFGMSRSTSCRERCKEVPGAKYWTYSTLWHQCYCKENNAHPSPNRHCTSGPVCKEPTLNPARPPTQEPTLNPTRPPTQEPTLNMGVIFESLGYSWGRLQHAGKDAKRYEGRSIGRIHGGGNYVVARRTTRTLNRMSIVLPGLFIARNRR